MGASKAEKQRRYRHGLATLKAGVSKLGSRAIDGRYRVARALTQWRRELINDLGGEDNISTQQRTVIELAAASKLLIGSIDAWLLSQPTLLTRDKTLLPVIRERQAIADGLVRYLAQLGLERRSKPLDLARMLARRTEQNSTKQPQENDNHESQRTKTRT
jgi:hypothetical protein